jgi:hypothetical protein
MVDAIAAKAAKVVVFFDSCFSGGAMTTRSVKPKAAGDVSFRPKFYPRADQASWTQCGDPVNMRSLPRALQEGKNNLVFIAAADFNEVALDGGPRSGGLATSSWMNCLNGKADKDKSGALSAQELAECAHEQVTEVSQRPPLDRNKAVQHITIEGNRSLVMAFNDDGKGKPAPTPAPTPTPTPTPAPVATDTGSPLAMLNDLYQSRNPQWSVELKPGKERVNFRNKEIVELGVTSKKDGYLYLVMVGSSNKEGYILFPNEHDPDNQVRAGQSVTLPKLPASGKKWKIVPGGPAGTDHILALVSETPLNLEDAPTQKVGQFKAYKADRNILSKLQRTFTRDLVAVSDEEVSLNFGAAMAKIVEFE